MTEYTHPTIAELLEELPDSFDADAITLVRAAHAFAEEAHDGQKRPSGELYIEHNRSVAKIMCQLDIEVNSVAAALLYDAGYAHTNKNIEDLSNAFPATIVDLVVGIQNLYDFAAEDSYQKHREGRALENIRRAILSIIEGDIHIILVRMAICLQELRQAKGIDDAYRIEIATEAKNIYAPLANRLGVWQLKWEIEDLAFRYLQRELYDDIADALKVQREERTRKIEQATKRLEEALQAIDVEAVVNGRSKHIYSIYRKMQRKNIGIQDVHDVQALRVIVEPHDLEQYDALPLHKKIEEDRRLCYQALGAVYSLWHPIAGEFDDYIAIPKPNGYQSLHTAVQDPENGDSLEVQIRSVRMHEAAERGVAAHWAYKEGGDDHVSSFAQRRIQSLRDLLSNIEEKEAAGDNGEAAIHAESNDRIYVYTPKGDVKDLLPNSTPIDFAYAIHTGVGHRCRGAKVNGKWVALTHQLSSGDRVEIITNKKPQPSRDWASPTLGYTTNPRTRTKVRQWFRQQDRDVSIENGRQAIQLEIKKLGLTGKINIADIANALRYDDVNDLLAKVGFGDVRMTQVSSAITILRQNLEPDDDDLLPLLNPPTGKKPKGITVRGVSNLSTKMAGCCTPIPPEPIIGYITRYTGVTIHRADCKEVERITERERLIEVDWGEAAETFPIPIVIEAYQRDKLIEDFSNILRGQRITTTKTKMMADGGIMSVYMVVSVTSMEQLQWLLDRFMAVPNVVYAQRQQWS